MLSAWKKEGAGIIELNKNEEEAIKYDDDDDVDFTYIRKSGNFFRPTRHDMCIRWESKTCSAQLARSGSSD